MQHAGNAAAFVLPMRRLRSLGKTEILRIAAPEFCFLGGTQRHHEIATEFALRTELASAALRKQSADRLRCTTQLIRDATILLVLWKTLARAMNFQRQRIGAPE